jgi:predicted lipid-binding transport protein (Tim44 family)
MRNFIALLVLALGLVLVASDADAARRFGGGGNLGRQRPAPTMKEAPQEAPATPPRAAQPTPSPTPGVTPTPVPRPSFMQRFGGLIAGLGIGALLGSLFGGHLGGVGSLVMLLILAALVYFAIRAFAARARGAPAATQPAYGSNDASYERVGNTYDATPAARTSPGFSGIGSAIPGASAVPGPATNALPAAQEPAVLQPDEVEPFLRVAKTSFIRLQAANDAGDLDDIRDYTTPEMYAEISMQVRERHAQQKTEVVDLDAQLVGTGVDDPYAYASVRFKGALRESMSGETEAFDEIWNVRRKLSDPRAPWLIAGIQQAA